MVALFDSIPCAFGIKISTKVLLSVVISTSENVSCFSVLHEKTKTTIKKLKSNLLVKLKLSLT